MTALISVLSVLTKGVTVLIICVFILGLFIYFCFKYISVLQKTKREIYEGINNLTETEGALLDSYYELHEKIKNNPSLKSVWQNFVDNLIEEDEEREMLVFSESPHSLFTVENILGPKINFYQLKAIPNYLTGIGITFTFLGLAAGIITGQQEFSIAQNPSNFMSALNNLLRGASLAFWTSIVGLITSIIFSALYKIYLHQIERGILKWNDILGNKIEVVKPKVELYWINKSIKEQNDIMRSFSTDLAIAIGKQLEEHVSPTLANGFADTFNALQELKDGISKIGNKLENITNDMIEADREFFSSFTKDFISVFKEEVSKQISETADSFQEINKILKDRILKLENLSLERELYLERLIECISESTEVQNKIISRVNGTVSTLESFIEQLVKISDYINESVALLTRSTNQVSDFHKKILADIKEFQDIFSKHLENLVKLNRDIRDISEEYVDKFLHIDKDFEQFLLEFEKYLDSIKHFSITATKEFENACNILSGVIRDLDATINDLGNNLLFSISKSAEK